MKTSVEGSSLSISLAESEMVLLTSCGTYKHSEAPDWRKDTVKVWFQRLALLPQKPTAKSAKLTEATSPLEPPPTASPHAHLPVWENAKNSKKRCPTVKPYPHLHCAAYAWWCPDVWLCSAGGQNSTLLKQLVTRHADWCISANATRPLTQIASRKSGSGEWSVLPPCSVPFKEHHNNELRTTCFAAVGAAPALNSLQRRRAIWLCGLEQITAASLWSLVNQSFTQ